MGLTATDLRAIRTIVREEIEPLEGRAIALENDLKEIYFIAARLDKRVSRFDNKLTRLDKRVTQFEAAGN